jgi:hypothetical protein
MKYFRKQLYHAKNGISSLILTCPTFKAILTNKQDRDSSSKFALFFQFMEKFLHQCNDMVWKNRKGYKFLHRANIWQFEHLAYILPLDQSPCQCVAGLKVPNVARTRKLEQVRRIKESDGFIHHLQCAAFNLSHP